MRFVASEMPTPSAHSIEGHVHSVFRRVVNLRLADGDLLTLYAGDEDRQPPGAVRFAAPPAFDFSNHISHQAAVSDRAGILRIAGTDFSLDLRQARANAQAPIEPTQAGSGFSGSWRAGWHTLLSINVAAGLVVSLNGRRAAGSLDHALAARARKSVPRLLNAAQKNDIEAAVAAAVQLVGAGPGLTPSGDDFLAGFLAGARQTAQSDSDIRFVDTLARRLTAYDSHSCDISRSYLRHAAAGRIARPLAKLSQSIAAGAPPTTIKPATVAAMHMGHSSGADASFGLLCGLAVQRPDIIGIIVADLRR